MTYLQEVIDNLKPTFTQVDETAMPPRDARKWLEDALEDAAEYGDIPNHAIDDIREREHDDVQMWKMTHAFTDIIDGVPEDLDREKMDDAIYDAALEVYHQFMGSVEHKEKQVREAYKAPKKKAHVYRNTMLGGKTQRVYNVAYDDKLVGHITFEKKDDAWYWKLYEPNNRTYAKSGVAGTKNAARDAIMAHIKKLDETIYKDGYNDKTGMKNGRPSNDPMRRGNSNHSDADALAYYEKKLEELRNDPNAFKTHIKDAELMVRRYSRGKKAAKHVSAKEFTDKHGDTLKPVMKRLKDK